MIKIDLTGLRFYAYHGLYEEERKTGNEFEVNLSVSYTPVSEMITELSGTIDYGKLYELLKAEMKQPRHLLETLVMEIAEAIHAKFPLTTTVVISIKKLNLPIARFKGTATVSYSKTWP